MIEERKLRPFWEEFDSHVRHRHSNTIARDKSEQSQ
jgi:hypothetical protein